MNTIQIVFFIACALVFMACIYLTVARCYATGIFGTIGLGLIALVTMIFMFEPIYGFGPPHSPQAMLLVIGMACFLCQHVFRVIWKAKKDRRRPGWRSILDKAPAERTGGTKIDNILRDNLHFQSQSELPERALRSIR